MSLGAAGVAGAAHAVPVACTAAGTKAIAPAMSQAQVCARFVKALGTAMRTRTVVSARPPVDGLSVELRFLPQGVASAAIVRWRGGKPKSLPRFELAVSDRKMLSSDIDKLADDAARGMMPIAKLGAK